MKSTLLTTLLLTSLTTITTTTTAWTIPPDTPDGLYSVHTSPTTNHEIHTLIHPSSHFNLKSLAHRRHAHPNPQPLLTTSRRRQSPTPNNYTCAGGPELEHTPTDDANNMLDAQCGHGKYVGAGLDYYSISGNTVAFFCNMNTRAGNNCYAWERQASSARLTKACGWYAAGEEFIPSHAARYGYRVKTDKFCGRGI